MSKLRPTLWRTCRAIASETRLMLLWEIFKGDEQSVAELAHCIGISEGNASIQLRALNARGLITAYRRDMMVFYHAEANSEVDYAEQLLQALRTCFEERMAFEKVIREATAFTHARRIEIVRALSDSSQDFSDLLKSTGISSTSLSLHLKKLESRRVISTHGGKYRLNAPKDALGRCLMKFACL